MSFSELMKIVGVESREKVVPAEGIMALKVTLKNLCGNLAWACVLVWLSAAVGYAQGTKGVSAPIIIDQTVAFSWPILLCLVMAAGGYVTMAMSTKVHHDNKAIHVTPEQAAELSNRPEICDLKHIAMMQQFAHIREQFANHESIFKRIEDKVDRLTERTGE